MLLRIEANYADKRKKRFIPLKYEDHDPSGWLGLLIGTLIYYDVSTVEALEKNFEAIVKDIKREPLPTVSSGKHVHVYKIASLGKHTLYATATYPLTICSTVTNPLIDVDPFVFSYISRYRGAKACFANYLIPYFFLFFFFFFEEKLFLGNILWYRVVYEEGCADMSSYSYCYYYPGIFF